MDVLELTSISIKMDHACLIVLPHLCLFGKITLPIVIPLVLQVLIFLSTTPASPAVALVRHQESKIFSCSVTKTIIQTRLTAQTLTTAPLSYSRSILDITYL